ncbi:MAG: adenylate/guanylate cyclase domain-containing protein [Paracoccaceae bacterium]|nr:adenylate/guanylate cyclase domain-containing protein [Paracoccaceae bacterium]
MLKDKQPKQPGNRYLPEIALAPTYKAVLVADTVGYSRLMEADSVGTYQRFRSLRVNVIDPLIVSCRGSTVKNTGDGFICEFDVPSDAFLCVSELHHKLREAQPKVAPDLEIVLRVGLHWGRVIYDADDIFGHVVNVAARLQELAPPRGTVLSRELLAHIEVPGGTATSDLGNLQLKNLEQPVAAALLGEPQSFPQTIVEGEERRDAMPSIALLPFENLTEAPETASLVSGFIDDINTSLSNLRDIFTVSNGSTVGIDLTRWTRDQIVEKLGVQYLFSGRIRSHGLQWRLSVELTDATRNEVVWAEKYEILMDEIFDLQDEITLSIVRQISSHIQSQQVRKAMRKAPQNLTAYDYYLRALNLLYQLRPENFEEAKNLLNNAIREDNSFGAPFALLSHWHMFRVAEGWSDNPDAEIGQVMRAANRAIELDPSNALAHALLGQAKGLFEHDAIGARSSVDRARELSPNNAWAWTFSSGPYGFSGDTKTAIRQAERGLRLSPLDQHVFFMQGLLAQNHYLHGNHLEGATWARRSLSANPRFGNAARVLIASLTALDDQPTATKIVKHHNALAPSFRLSDYRERCPFGREQTEIYVDRLRRAGVEY